MTAKCGETVNILRVAAPKRKKKHAVTLMTIGIESQGSSCLLYTSPSPRDSGISRMPSSA